MKRKNAHRNKNIKEKPYVLIFGRNPVKEALDANRKIEKILFANDTRGSIKEIEKMAEQKGITYGFFDKEKLNDLAGGSLHRGVIALAEPYRYSKIEDVLHGINEGSRLLLVLDHIEDPQNLGSIIRTAECAGASALIIPKARACEITPAVERISAGATQYMRCVQVSNIANAVEKLKKNGFWIAACDMDGEDYYKADMSGDIALVIGNEGRGISEIVKKKCDFTISVPMKGRINSLNAANAAAVIIYEVVRQRSK